MANLSEIYPIPYNTVTSQYFYQNQLDVDPNGKDRPLTKNEQLIKDFTKTLKDNPGKLLSTGADIFKDIYNAIDKKEIDYLSLTTNILGLASIFVPEIGFLAPLLGIFYRQLGLGNAAPEPTMEDIFQALKPKIEEMIQKSLTANQQKFLDSETQGLQDILGRYRDAIKTFAYCRSKK
ncbi:hypothetical protein ACT7C9_01220 [Bacillus cereus]